MKKLAKLRAIFSLLGLVISGAGESATNQFRGNNSEYSWEEVINITVKISE
jgi:hypothetical protein